MENDLFKYVIGAAVIAVIVSLAGAGGGGSKKTDGVFESATRKMDAGQPLNARETQRMSDIINWCNKCNQPLRTCKCNN